MVGQVLGIAPVLIGADLRGSRLVGIVVDLLRLAEGLLVVGGAITLGLKSYVGPNWAKRLAGGGQAQTSTCPHRSEATLARVPPSLVHIASHSETMVHPSPK